MGLLTTEIKEFVKKQKLGFVATVCPDGTPNLSPKGTTTVVSPVYDTDAPEEEVIKRWSDYWNSIYV